MRHDINLALALTVVCTALSGCGGGPLWDQLSDGYVNIKLQSCAQAENNFSGEYHRQCILKGFNIGTYNRPYLESLGFRCGFVDQYCLLHHTERQYGIGLLSRLEDSFFEYRTDIYLKYVDQKLSEFRMRYESVDAQGKIRMRYDTTDTLP